MTLGHALIYYSPQLALNPYFAPGIGDSYEAAGIQPNPGGVVLAGIQYDGAVLTPGSPSQSYIKATPRKRPGLVIF